MDFLERIRTRATERRQLAELPRKGICFGSLTQVVDLPIGAGVGQIASAQIASRNALSNSYLPAIGVWAATGTGAIGNTVSAFQWDANFIPVVMSIAAGAITDNLRNTNLLGTALVQGTELTVQGEFSIDSVFALANPSSLVRMELTWNGGELAWIDFSPLTGAIVASNGTLADIEIDTFTAASGASNVEFQVVRASFTTRTVGVATVASALRIYPARSALTGQVVVGGLQIEAGVNRSDFIPTFNANSATYGRRLGTIPRFNVDRSIAPISDTSGFGFSGNHTYQDVVDEGRMFQWGGNGTFTLINTNLGAWCKFVVGTGITTTIVPVAFLRLPDGTSPASLAITPVSGVISGTLVHEGGGNWRLFYDAPAGTGGGGAGTAPTTQVFTSGTAQTYTTPANCVAIQVELVGGGGGGGAAQAGTGATGGSTTFSTLTAAGGTGGAGNGGAGGAGGTATNGDVNLPGGKGDGGTSTSGANATSGGGGNSAFGGGGGATLSSAGIAGGTNTGGGGSGGSDGLTFAAGGGGAGAYCRKIIAAPAATYVYTVGGGGAGSTTTGAAGGAGAAGIIIVTEYY